MKADYIILILIITVFIAPFLFAYYNDFKRNSKEFEFEARNVFRGIIKFLLLLVLFFGLNKVSRLLIPLNKSNGIEFNSEREKVGLPKLDKHWFLDDSTDEQFTKTYWKQPKSKKGHFKKVIEYGILGPDYETDYYKNEKFQNTFVWSVYSFTNKKFEYFLEKPNTKIVSVNEKGNLKMEKPTVIVKINQQDFKNYILN